MSTVDWARAQLTDLQGRRALVTGAASGLGYETALGLAACGAQVVLADRNVVGGEAAVTRIRETLPGAQVSFAPLDLGDLAAIRAFAQRELARGLALDLLVNNAGLLPPLQRATTADGFELKFGVNVLGHFALTARLLPALLRSPAARVVWVSSLVHRHARIDFDDLNAERDYAHQRAYNQAKLACLMLAMETQARAQAAGVALTATAGHPGVSRTALGDSRKGQRRRTLTDHLADLGLWISMRWLSQGPGQGARSILYAAAAADAVGGGFYGPSGVGEMRGDPRRVALSAPAKDAGQRRRLWAACEALTGERYDWSAAAEARPATLSARTGVS